jgi:hypothetical protein
VNAHQFTRPGQVASGHPAPDACMVCGQPETAHRLDPGPLSNPGPYETSRDALSAIRPDDGSFTGRDAQARLLADIMRSAGVRLGGWDWIVLRWLADLDAPTVAVIAGWVQRAATPVPESGTDRPAGA